MNYDPYFAIVTLHRPIDAQRTAYLAMHQCYSDHHVIETHLDWVKCGEIVVDRLLKGNRGHYSPLEHCHIVLSCGYFPHSMVQQLTRHRLLSFSVQSFRYTSESVVRVARGDQKLEEVFYTRPFDQLYTNRQGKKYIYTAEDAALDKTFFMDLALDYKRKLDLGVSEEHARNLLPMDIRQHFVMSGNLRSMLHILDMRHKPDAQYEIQEFSRLLHKELTGWVPEIMGWYDRQRLNKGMLAP